MSESNAINSTDAKRWVSEIDARPATHRGRFVNKPDGIRERHSAADLAPVTAL